MWAFSIAITELSLTYGKPKSIDMSATASLDRAVSRIGKASMAACQLEVENVAEGDSLTVSLSDEWSSGSNVLLRFENPEKEVVKPVLFLLSSGDVGSAFSTVLTGSVSSFSGVGQIPNCSYRSKKLELVGGARKDMLVDRERGRMTAPELERGSDDVSDPDARGIVCVGPDKGVEDAEGGVGGRGEVGGGVSEDVEVDGEIGRPNAALAGKYDGLGGSSGGLSMVAPLGG